MSGPWSGVRVLELTGLTGAYATRLWAALGAEVVVAEPPSGHSLRHMAPFAGDESLWWAYFGTVQPRAEARLALTSRRP